MRYRSELRYTTSASMFYSFFNYLAYARSRPLQWRTGGSLTQKPKAFLVVLRNIYCRIVTKIKMKIFR